MVLLVIGLICFLGIHVVPATPGLRIKLISVSGLGIYKLGFSIASAVTLAMIIIGYKDAHWSGNSNVQLWTLPEILRPITVLLMLPAFILFVSAYVPSRIRNAAKHPMLMAVTIWAFAHLLVRGDLASVLLFGGFLAFAIVDRISATKRHALGPLGQKNGALRGDLISIAIGTIAFAAMVLWLHGRWFGAPLLS